MGFLSGLQCDRCGARVMYHEESSTVPKWLLERRGRRNGWSSGKRVLCPRCRRETSNGRRP